MPHTVLCVDDDRNLCQILAKALSGEGYQVRTAHDGEEALTSFEQVPPDLVLLDCLLPRRDGFGVLQQIRAMGGPAGDTPALFLSGCSRTPEYLERAQALGAGAFLTKPVPLDVLLENVRKHLSSAPKAQPAAKPSAPEAPKLKGSLEEIAFPTLLHQLHGLRATGALLLRSGKKRKGLQFRDGRGVGVKSNLVHECLGNLLGRMGRIDKETLQESIRRMKSGEGFQGEILVAMQVLSEDELANALRVQAEEKLFEVFEWEAGTFEFKRGGRLKGANSLSLERSPADVIVEGIRRRYPIQRIDAYLQEHADEAIVGGEIPFYMFQEVELSDTTQAMLQRGAEGELPMAQVLAGDEAQRRMLYGLLAAQLVELKPGNAGSPVSAAAAARARLAAARSSRPNVDDSGVRKELAAMADRMRGKDFFEVLGVGRECSDEDVRTAYVHLAKRTHPDRFSGYGDAIKKLAEEIFGLVSQAQEHLSDRRRRESYLLEMARGQREAEALEEGRRALEAERHFQQGEAALRTKRHASAFAEFQRAVELYPEESEYLAYWAWTRYLTADDKDDGKREALKALKRSIKLNPDGDTPYIMSGRLFKVLGEPDKAERMWLKAVQVKSDCVEALRELRLVNLRREKQKGLVQKLFRR